MKLAFVLAAVIQTIAQADPVVSTLDLDWRPACDGATIEVTSEQKKLLSVHAIAFQSDLVAEWTIHFIVGRPVSAEYRESIRDKTSEGAKAGGYTGHAWLKTIQTWGWSGDHFPVEDVARNKELADILIKAQAKAEHLVADQVKKEAGYFDLGDYIPRKASSLDDVPEPVRTRLVNHLKQRLGERFYSTLHLAGGQIVDFDEFHRREVIWRDYKWEVFAYNLLFQFRLPEKGIEYYTAGIRLRSDGSVIEEIDLPDIAKHPEHGDFVPLSTAKQAAAAAGFDLSRCQIEIDYRRKDDRCVYFFRQLTRHEGVLLHFNCLEVDAHTGKNLGSYLIEGIE